MFLKKRKEKRKYVARSGIERRTPDLRVRCPTDCATRSAHLCNKEIGILTLHWQQTGRKMAIQWHLCGITLPLIWLYPGTNVAIHWKANVNTVQVKLFYGFIVSVMPDLSLASLLPSVHQPIKRRAIHW